MAVMDGCEALGPRVPWYSGFRILTLACFTLPSVAEEEGDTDNSRWAMGYKGSAGESLEGSVA